MSYETLAWLEIGSKILPLKTFDSLHKIWWASCEQKVAGSRNLN